MTNWEIALIFLITIVIIAKAIFGVMTLPAKIRAYKHARGNNATIYVARKYAKHYHQYF